MDLIQFYNKTINKGPMKSECFVNCYTEQCKVICIGYLSETHRRIINKETLFWELHCIRFKNTSVSVRM